MADESKFSAGGAQVAIPQSSPQPSPQQEQPPSPKQKFRGKGRSSSGSAAVKRRCVSTACIACRKRKSKCDGSTPSCAACSSVYHTPCVYDPNSDHRRKGVYKQDIDNLRNRNTTLQTLIQAILNYDEEDVPELVRQIRACEDLEEVAESIVAKEKNFEPSDEKAIPTDDESHLSDVPQFESQLSGKMSELMLDGSVKVVGGTSNLIFIPPDLDIDDLYSVKEEDLSYQQQPKEPITTWTKVTKNKELIRHLLTMYFTWHYAYFTTLSKRLFYRDFIEGRSSQYCSPLLVNAMLALGCHFSSWPAARDDPNNSATAGDHFFKEAKRLILENDEHEKAKLCTVQALALMSVREAGCGREGSGWVYSGMSFRMAYDLGLNVGPTGLAANSLSDEDVDARRITFWGCFLFDKCWSNYLGRQPQLSGSNITVPKFDVFPDEDAETWCPYTDSGVSREHQQASRTRAVALQICRLCEISDDLLRSFYNPVPVEKHIGKQEELKRLSQLHTRLEAWRKNLPKEMEPKEGQLPQVLVMHMFFQLLFIHLYRPFLKYTKSTSPLPAHVSPRKLCTQAASMVSKLLRIYKRSYGLRQICNVAVYIAHSACTIHLLNLPDKSSKRDLLHGLKNLEEIAESWPCARRTLRILDLSARKWRINLPSEAITILERCHAKFGSWGTWDHVTSPSNSDGSPGSQNVPLPSTGTTGHHTPDPASATVERSRQQLARAPPPPDLTFTRYEPDFLVPSQGQQPVPSHPQQQKPSMGPSLAASYPRPTNTQPTSSNWMRPHIPAPKLPPGSSSPVTLGTPQIAAPFPGLDKLPEENQDWWLKDQSALAFGLDNWPDTWDTTASGSGGAGIDFESALQPTSHPVPDIGHVQGEISGAPSNLAMSMPVTLPGYESGYMAEVQNPQGRQHPVRKSEGSMGNMYYTNL